TAGSTRRRPPFSLSCGRLLSAPLRLHENTSPRRCVGRFRQQEVVMSRCYVPCSVLAMIILNICAARSGEPPGAAKPIPESERQSRLELPAGALARFGNRQAQPDARNLLVAFSPDGKRLAFGGRDDTVTLWDVATGKELRQLEGLSRVLCFAFSPDGKYLATANLDRMIHLWEVDRGKERRHFVGHQGTI